MTPTLLAQGQGGCEMSGMAGEPGSIAVGDVAWVGTSTERGGHRGGKDADGVNLWRSLRWRGW